MNTEYVFFVHSLIQTNIQNEKQRSKEKEVSQLNKNKLQPCYKQGKQYIHGYIKAVKAKKKIIDKVKM